MTAAGTEITFVFLAAAADPAVRYRGRCRRRCNRGCRFFFVLGWRCCRNGWFPVCGLCAVRRRGSLLWRRSRRVGLLLIRSLVRCIASGRCRRRCLNRFRFRLDQAEGRINQAADQGQPGVFAFGQAQNSDQGQDKQANLQEEVDNIVKTTEKRNNPIGVK